MNHRGLGTTEGADGRAVHYFSQSLLNTYLQCPEQARYELSGEVARVESPKMALGTAGHAAIEATLRGQVDGFEDAARVMLETFEERTWLEEFRPEEGLGMDWAKKRGVSALNAWWEEVRPQVVPSAIEWPFEYKLYEDDHRVIFMKGTVDCVDEKGVIWDWKFSGSERKEWKDNRGSIQAAAYTRAVPTNYFKYAVMHEQGVQIVDLTQGKEHWDWLAWQAVTLAKLVEADIAPWPVNDSDWWCSPRWCNVFAAGACKGAFFPERVRNGR